MEKSLISIIVPVYNTKEYLVRCVNSLCAQTYENIEILLVDDGSLDGSAALCDELKKKDERIKVFHKENGGSSSARNLGLLQAKGEWIGFVDSDDYVDEDMYELLYAGANQFGVKVAQVGRNEICEDGTQMPDICIPPKEACVIEHGEMLKELLMHRGDCSFCTKLFHRDILADRSFPIGALNEDFHLLIELLPLMERLVSLPKQAYHVFLREGSNTRKKGGFSRVFADNIDNADWVLDRVKTECPELLPVAFRFGIFQRIDYMLHIPIEQMERSNERYKDVVRYLQKNWWKGMCNPILTAKNKVYHTLFAFVPKISRVIHKKLKKL